MRNFFIAVFSLFICSISAQELTYRTIEDIAYTQSPDLYALERCKLDIYYPENATDCPTVVWFHGGGLSKGNKSIPGRLKNSGLIVIAVNYRLLPQATLSECIDDAAASVAWAFGEVEKYGGDKRKIFISGHSAGGYLTNMIGLDKKWLHKYNIDADSIAGLIPFSGHAISHFAYRESKGMKPTQPSIDEFAPLYYVRPDAPPLIIISGDREMELFGRYEETAYFWRMMKVVGHKETYLYEIDGHDHGAMGEPAHHILKNHIKTILKSREDTNNKIKLEVTVLDSDYIFMSPDPIKINVDLQNYEKRGVIGRLFVSLTTDDYRTISLDSLDIDIDGYKNFNKDFVYHHPNPGFYRYSVYMKQNNHMICEKKFNVGYEPEKIVSPIDAKADFKAFWDDGLKELKKIRPHYKLTHIPDASKLDYDMYLVEMRSFRNEEIKGYYAKPKRKGKHPVIVEYMGYGSTPYYPNQSWDGFAYFVLSIRGQALNQPTSKYGTWITYGLEDKNKYYYRGAFLDVIRALDFVSSRTEIDSERIAVRGGSQGGALSFVAAALDKRVKVAAPTIPFLSDYPDYFNICPWPKRDFNTYMQSHPENKWEDIFELLTYFDIKNLAQWIECPLIMGVGVQDNVCPPHINFAAYNQVKSNKIWIAYPECGHSVGKEFYNISMELFRETLGVDRP